MSKSGNLMRSMGAGVGIVVSILLAFGIDALWEEKSERAQEEALLGGLRGEFDVNLHRLDQMLAEFHEQDSLLVRFFDLATPDTEQEAEVEVGRTVLALLWAAQFDPSTGTLEMILNAGRLDLFSDPELRDLLWTWKMQVEDLEDDTGGFRYFIEDGRDILARLGARGFDSDLRPPWREQFDRIRSSHEINALAQTVLTDRRSYWRELEVVRATTALVLQALQ